MSIELHPAAVVAIDERGSQLLSEITELKFSPHSKPEFQSEKPTPHRITDKDIVEEPFFEGTDESGTKVLSFIFKDGCNFGLVDKSFENLAYLSDQFLKWRWARDRLSRKFVELEILKWCRLAFGKPSEISLSNFLVSESKKSVRNYTMWAPIAHLEVEARFSFGPVTIAPMSAAMFQSLETQSVESSPSQAADITALFQKLRERMQGLAAVVLEFESEPNYAHERGTLVATDAVGLLRFFSVASYGLHLICPNAPLGSEYLPQSHTILLGNEGSISIREAIISPNVAYWSLSSADLERLRSEGLIQAGTLVIDQGLTQFEQRVRTSVMALSKGTTLPDVADRLVYTISALEGLLLKNSSEPLQQNLAERMAFALVKDPAERREIVRNVRVAYEMRSQYIHHRNFSSEEQEIQTFIVWARAIIKIALMKVDKFKTSDEFIEAIDQLKFGG